MRRTFMDIRDIFNLKEVPKKPIPSELFYKCGFTEKAFIRYLSLCEYVKSVCAVDYFRLSAIQEMANYYKKTVLSNMKNTDKEYISEYKRLITESPLSKHDNTKFVIAAMRVLISFLESFSRLDFPVELDGLDPWFLQGACYYWGFNSHISIFKSLDDFRCVLEYMISVIISDERLPLDLKYFGKGLDVFTYEELVEYEEDVRQEMNKYSGYEPSISDADDYQCVVEWARENEEYVKYCELEELLNEINNRKEELLNEINNRKEDLLVENEERKKQREESNPKFKNSTILYIHKGSIKCLNNKHEIVMAQVAVPSIDGEIRINVYYCTECHKFFLDRNSYDMYRKKYKFLPIIFSLVSDDGEYISKTKGTIERSSDSPLSLCGYTVNKKENLSAEKRQRILRFIIEQGILSKEQVLRYLNLFIEVNGSNDNMYEATCKWNADKEYVVFEITSYEVVEKVYSIEKWKND